MILHLVSVLQSKSWYCSSWDHPHKLHTPTADYVFLRNLRYIQHVQECMKLLDLLTYSSEGHSGLWRGFLSLTVTNHTTIWGLLTAAIWRQVSEFGSCMQLSVQKDSNSKIWFMQKTSFNKLNETDPGQSMLGEEIKKPSRSENHCIWQSMSATHQSNRAPEWNFGSCRPLFVLAALHHSIAGTLTAGCVCCKPCVQCEHSAWNCNAQTLWLARIFTIFEAKVSWPKIFTKNCKVII